MIVATLTREISSVSAGFGVFGGDGAAPRCAAVERMANASENDPIDDVRLEYPAGARVTRSLQAKWESEQSPTQHKPD